MMGSELILIRLVFTDNLGPFVEPHVPTNLLPPFPVNSSFPCEQLPSTYR